MNYKTIIKIVGLGLIIVLSAGIFYFSLKGLLFNTSKNQKAISLNANIESFPVRKQEVANLEITAQSGLSIYINNSGTDKILFEKSSNKILPIASLTKLMTALIALENIDPLEQITISSQAAGQEKIRKLFNGGEVFTAENLIKSMLVESNNSSAYALYEFLGKEKFILSMNTKAKEMGLKNTEFKNPTGMGPENLSTVSDLAQFAKYLVKTNSPILQISQIKEFDLLEANNKFHHKVLNLNDLLKNPDFSEKIILGKTGETAEAKQCLLIVTKSPINKNYIINVILGSTDRFKDMEKLINWQTPFNANNLIWQEQKTNQPMWQARDSHGTVVFNNKLWVMGGLDANCCVVSADKGLVAYEKAIHFSDVWSSADGKNWQLVTQNADWGKRRSIQVVNFNNKMWIFGGWGPEIGYKNDVWSSADSKNWQLENEHAEWPSREGHSVLVFNNILWLVGGVRYDDRKLFNDVWYSSDGINWKLATINANWSARWDHAMTVFDNKLWLSGGMAFEDKLFKDVWYSSDGINWKLATNNPGFATRQGHGMVSYKNKIWVISRFNPEINGGENDVWYSNDGIIWEKTKINPAWTGREDTSILIFKDKIWVLGGMDKNWQWRNDIWYSSY